MYAYKPILERLFFLFEKRKGSFHWPSHVPDSYCLLLSFYQPAPDVPDVENLDAKINSLSQPSGNSDDPLVQTLLTEEGVPKTSGNAVFV